MDGPGRGRCEPSEVACDVCDGSVDDDDDDDAGGTPQASVPLAPASDAELAQGDEDSEYGSDLDAVLASMGDDPPTQHDACPRSRPPLPTTYPGAGLDLSSGRQHLQASAPARAKHRRSVPEGPPVVPVGRRPGPGAAPPCEPPAGRVARVAGAQTVRGTGAAAGAAPARRARRDVHRAARPPRPALVLGQPLPPVLVLHRRRHRRRLGPRPRQLRRGGRPELQATGGPVCSHSPAEATWVLLLLLPPSHHVRPVPRRNARQVDVQKGLRPKGGTTVPVPLHATTPVLRHLEREEQLGTEQGDREGEHGNGKRCRVRDGVVGWEHAIPHQ